MITDADAAYDRLESLGEARAFNGVPEPWDDEFWNGVLYDAPCSPPGKEQHALQDIHRGSGLHRHGDTAPARRVLTHRAQ